MWGTSLDLICMAWHANFANVLGNRCMQSATDDPGLIPPSMGHQILHQRRGLIVGQLYSKYVEGSQSLHMLRCVCTGGGNVCLLRVRGLSRRRH